MCAQRSAACVRVLIIIPQSSCVHTETNALSTSHATEGAVTRLVRAEGIRCQILTSSTERARGGIVIKPTHRLRARQSGAVSSILTGSVRQISNRDHNKTMEKSLTVTKGRRSYPINNHQVHVPARLKRLLSIHTPNS